MERVQQGDGLAFRTLLDEVGPMVSNFLRRRMADPNEIEDVFQETLLALYQARHTYEPSRPLEPWLFAIARNVAADHAHRYWNRARWQELAEVPPEAASHVATNSKPNLEEALNHLSPVQREAFVMLKLEGLSTTEAAQRAGVSVGALKVRAHRAYETLKRIILR
ncbi:MAG TPA: RNA polymerase sigma factor [Candidatus Binataceae bacterium]|nr:RNA polymerase sigma factor [Candidatus Binataceae bacterium]